MRTKKSLINIAVGFVTYAIIMVGQFYVQRLFFGAFGAKYNGISFSFEQLIAGLAIVELGLGVGIVYKLYKPIAEKNWNQVAIMLKFLRKAYMIIAGIVLASGAVASFFVKFVMNEADAKEFAGVWLSWVFIIYVLDVICSYLYAHKRSIFIADQNMYFINAIHTFIQIFLFVIQILVLNIFQSFEGFLICKIVCRLLENLIIGYMFKKKYSFINLKIKDIMPVIERKDLFKNMKALLCHRISSFFILSGSNFLITKFIGLSEGGIYKNYYLIISALHLVTNEFFNGIVASFGNLLNTESKDKVYSNFNVIYLLNFFVYSFVTASFFNIVTPFIRDCWMVNRINKSEEVVFAMAVTIAITAYVYIYGMKQSITMAKISAGIYDEDKYAAIIGVVIAFFVSLILVKPLGIAGVMIGNIIGIIAVPQWVAPKLVYRMIFKKKSKVYQYKFMLYTAFTLFYTYLTYVICSRLQVPSDGMKIIMFRVPSGVLRVAVNFAVCLLIPNVLNILFFCKTQEFKILWKKSKSFLKNRQ